MKNRNSGADEAVLSLTDKGLGRNVPVATDRKPRKSSLGRKPPSG
jgi:hypothetical protein